MRGLMWFREDLRTTDNTALYHAAKQCDEGVVALYLIDPAMWRDHAVAPCRIAFILRGLQALEVALASLNIALHVVSVQETSSIPAVINECMLRWQADALFFNRQYEVNEARRDQAVAVMVKAANKSCYAHDDQTILPPGSVTKHDGQNYSVFTPYKRAWQDEWRRRGGIKVLPAPKPQLTAHYIPSNNPIPGHIAGFESSIDPVHWPAGPEAAKQRLNTFIEQKLFLYAQQRDFPAVAGTSVLSPYLATGMISPRQCFSAALTENNHELDTGNLGALTWMTELIWREFYKHILIAVPRIAMHRAYKRETEQLPWHYDEKLLQAWQTGQTGFPLVDAAMRQLNTIGWMHNRLRMVTAMFLSKNLFLDWRLGEQYFMQHLIDGDLAANNGGWQWSASTGTDAVPYFRMFNPIRQSERFDPEGVFIRQYCPELVGFTAKQIHQPYAGDPERATRAQYPRPIVDLTQSRARVIAAFKSL